MRRGPFFAAAALAALLQAPVTAQANDFLLPFFPTPLVPSHRPLAFGMTVEDAATALDTPLVFVSGRPGNEIRVATLPGRALFPRGDRVYLQFRKGRLTGWKGDWTIAWVGP
jgi:hypothetical protein